MAVCLKCSEPMAQTEPVCRNCGADYQDSEKTFGDIVFRQSSLVDLFRLVSVMAFFFAFLPVAITFVHAALWPFSIGILCGLSVLLLGDSSELFVRLLSLAGVIAFLLYPLLGVYMLIGWLLNSFGIL